MSHENEPILTKSMPDERKRGETLETYLKFLQIILKKLLVSTSEKWKIRIKNMSFFAIKEIEIHWESSQKIPGLSIIVKTLDGGRKFKEERYSRNLM